MNRLRKPAATVCWLLPLLFGSVLLTSGDTIWTRDGQIFRGRIIDRKPEQVKIRTNYGPLTIPSGDVTEENEEVYVVELNDDSRLEGAVIGETKDTLLLKVGEEIQRIPLKDIENVAPRTQSVVLVKLSPEEVAVLHAKAIELIENKRAKDAVKIYKKLLKNDPDDQLAHYNLACCYALNKQSDKAMVHLTEAVENGFADFRHIENDKDLASLRGLDAYKALMAKRETYTKMAADRAVEWIGDHLRGQGIDASAYKSVFDEERNFMYLHTRSTEELDEIREMLNTFAAYQWKYLFKHKPSTPIYIVLLTREDSPKVLGPNKGGVFNPASNILFCGHMPGLQLRRSSVIVHEFTHALHFADQNARSQRQPTWLVEGLASLFETTKQEGDKILPKHSYRLRDIQDAILSGRTLPWPRYMSMSARDFMSVPDVNYAMGRYMLYYMHEKGLLRKFYDEYTHGAGFEKDPTALATFETVFGKPLHVVERDWKKWINQQVVPPIPFLGVGMDQVGEDEVKVTRVMPDSAAEVAGLRDRDIITSIDGDVIRSPDDVLEIVRGREVGEALVVEIKRSGKMLAVRAELLERPEDRRRRARPPSKPSYLGLAVQEKDGAMVIREVDKGSPAAEAGLEVGMELLKVNGLHMDFVREYLEFMRKTRPRQTVRLTVKDADGKEKEIRVRLAEVPDLDE